MALYIHVNGMRQTSDLFTEQTQIQTYTFLWKMFTSFVSAGTESEDSGNKGNTVTAKVEKAVWLGNDGCWLLRHFVTIPWQISFPGKYLSPKNHQKEASSLSGVYET